MFKFKNSLTNLFISYVGTKQCTSLSFMFYNKTKNFQAFCSCSHNVCAMKTALLMSVPWSNGLNRSPSPWHRHLLHGSSLARF